MALRIRLVPLSIRKMSVETELESLRDYAHVLEDFLANERDKINALTQEKSRELLAERSDNDEDYQDDYLKLDKDFPKKLRLSLFVTCCSLLEDELIRLAELIGQLNNNRFDVSQQRGSVYQYVADYFGGMGISFPNNHALWYNIDQYRDLRNITVHSRGQLKLLSQLYQLRSNDEDIENRKKRLSQSEQRALTREEGVLNFVKSNPLLFSLDLSFYIHPSKDFCLTFIDAIDSFFDELYKRLLNS